MLLSALRRMMNATLAHREAVRADAFFALGRARPLRLRLQSRRHE